MSLREQIDKLNAIIAYVKNNLIEINYYGIDSTRKTPGDVESRIEFSTKDLKYTIHARGNGEYGRQNTKLSIGIEALPNSPLEGMFQELDLPLIKSFNIAQLDNSQIDYIGQRMLECRQHISKFDMFNANSDLPYFDSIVYTQIVNYIRLKDPHTSKEFMDNVMIELNAELRRIHRENLMKNRFAKINWSQANPINTNVRVDYYLTYNTNSMLHVYYDEPILFAYLNTLTEIPYEILDPIIISYDLQECPYGTSTINGSTTNFIRPKIFLHHTPTNERFKEIISSFNDHYAAFA